VAGLSGQKETDMREYVETIRYADGFGGNRASLIVEDGEWLTQAYGSDLCVHNSESEARATFDRVKAHIAQKGYRILN
jgi:hypothetical protein